VNGSRNRNLPRIPLRKASTIRCHSVGIIMNVAAVPDTYSKNGRYTVRVGVKFVLCEFEIFTEA
jgi:hypothetical protein